MKEALLFALRQHPCVIVPRWGAFVRVSARASIDSKAHEILPPREIVHFNRSLQIEDDVLAIQLSALTGMNVEDARREISAEVKRWEGALQRDKKLELEGIGYFSRNGEKIQFHPEPSVALQKSSFGLTQVALPQVQSSQPVIKKPLPWLRRPFARAGVGVGVAAAIIVLLGFLHQFEPQSKNAGLAGLDSPLTLAASANPKQAQTEPEKEETSSSETEVLSLDSQAEIPASSPVSEEATQPEANTPEPVAPKTEAPKPEVAKPVAPETKEVTSKGRFYVIGGSFGNEVNAEKYRSQLSKSQLESHILHTNGGPYRVFYTQPFTDSLAADAHLHHIRTAHNPAAWLLKW